MPARLFTDSEVDWISKTYSVVVLSGGGFDAKLNMSIAQGVMNVSARIKARNPAIKVMQYFNMQGFAGYDSTDPALVNFLAHPEWWLLDDNNNVIRHFGSPGGSPGSPEYDWSNPAAVQNFLEMPLVGPEGTSLIDGFLFDGGAIYDQPANMSASRAEALKIAKWAALGKFQQRLTKLNGGIALANGMIGGPIDPNNDPYNLDCLSYVNGIENERGTPVFELVNHTDGSFDLVAVAANLAAIEKASQMANGTKMVSVNYWPGSIIGLNRSNFGLPTFAPLDPLNDQPTGTAAEQYVAWQKILLKWTPFNLAMFLSVAGPSTYFTQMVWYAAVEGFLPCPDNPSGCIWPASGFPIMQNKLGAPQGPRVAVSQYKWVRHFEHAVVTLDLNEPLGPGTSIVWSA